MCYVQVGPVIPVRGDGEENKAECVCYFEAAIRIRRSDSAVQLGLLYEFGDFVDKDYDKAFELYSMAVKAAEKMRIFIWVRFTGIKTG